RAHRAPVMADAGSHTNRDGSLDRSRLQPAASSLVHRHDEPGRLRGPILESPRSGLTQVFARSEQDQFAPECAAVRGAAVHAPSRATARHTYRRRPMPGCSRRRRHPDYRGRGSDQRVHQSVAARTQGDSTLPEPDHGDRACSRPCAWARRHDGTWTDILQSAARGSVEWPRATADGRRGGPPHAESVVAASLGSGARASAPTARRFLSGARRTATIGGVDWTYGFYAGSVTSDWTSAAESDRRRGVQRLWRDLHHGRRRGGSHHVADWQSAGLGP